MSIVPIGPTNSPALFRVDVSGEGYPDDPDQPNDPLPIFPNLGFELSVTAAEVVVGTAISVIRLPTYIRDGVDWVPDERAVEWVAGGVVVGSGLSYTPTLGQAVAPVDQIIDPDTGVVWTGDPVRGATITAVSALVDPGEKPTPPTADEWDVVRTVFKDGQTDLYKPILAFSGRLDDPGAEVQWTSSFLFPADPGHWEPLLSLGGGEYTLSHSIDGPENFWAYFSASPSQDNRRNSQFRIRWRLNGSDWSDESTFKPVPIPPLPSAPAAPTNPVATAGVANGSVTLAATPPTDFGDDATSVTLQYAVSANGPWTDLPVGQFILSAGFWGSTVTFHFTALNNIGRRSEAVTASATIAGTGGWPFPGKWARMTHPDPTTLSQNENGWQPGEGRLDVGKPHQFLHGGARSLADDNVAGFTEDVSPGPWITENANDPFPRWRHAAARGMQAVNGSCMLFDPTIRNRLIVVASEGGKTTNQGHGIFVSNNLGDDYVHALATFVPGARNDGERWRTQRQLLGFKPDNPDHWIFVNAHHNVWNSVDRGDAWYLVSSFLNASNMDQVWATQVSRHNNNHVWLGCGTGLWKTTNFGASLFKPETTGLPSGHVTSIVQHPTDDDTMWAVVYGNGLFKTTNANAATPHFTRVGLNDNRVAQVAICETNPNHMWVTGIQKSPANTNWNSLTQYSNNGGTSWQNCTSDTSANGSGYTGQWLGVFREWGRSQLNMASAILPSRTNPGKAVGTAQTQIWTIDGKTITSMSIGFDTLACGEAGFQNIAFHPLASKKDWIAIAFFDKKLHVSKNNGQSFAQKGSASAGFSGLANCHSCPDINKDTDDIIFSSGRYHGEKKVIISRNFGDGASFVPGFFNNNKREFYCQWAQDDTKYAYSTSGISDDYGSTWERWQDYGSGFGFASSGLRAGVFASSPSDPKVLWAQDQSCQQLGRSTDRGKNWSIIVQNCGISIFEPMGGIGFCPDPTDAGAIYWWSLGNGIRRWKAGVGVTTYTPVGVDKNQRVARIRIDPSQGTHIVYLFLRNESRIVRDHNAAGTVVLRSVGGINGPYENISGNLPTSSAQRSLELDPHRGKIIVTGTIGSRFMTPPYAPDPDDVALALRNGV